jgi:hypothetical protein
MNHALALCTDIEPRGRQNCGRHTPAGLASAISRFNGKHALRLVNYSATTARQSGHLPLRPGD